jgi:sulfhydrogenase subunit delta
VTRARVAVWKFASCDGCQLTLLDCVDELVVAADRLEIVHFVEAGAIDNDDGGRYDLSIVEGSISTPHDLARICDIRQRSVRLVTIGACASAGGIQALRNYARADEYLRIVYARPEYIATLAASTPISDHVAVDFELRGCPIDRRQLLQVITAFTTGYAPALSAASVCAECKRAGHVCVTVAHGIPCLGPMTHAGCGALCPACSRGCYGCFGPSESANLEGCTTVLRRDGMGDADITRSLRTFNAWDPVFRAWRGPPQEPT